VILDYLASKTISSNDLVVVSPDVGGVARARAFAKKLSDAPLAIVDKRRHGHNVAEVITTTKSVHYPLLYIFLELPLCKLLYFQTTVIGLLLVFGIYNYICKFPLTGTLGLTNNGVAIGNAYLVCTM
jgi:plasmid stabilization system protein ParE